MTPTAVLGGTESYVKGTIKARVAAYGLDVRWVYPMDKTPPKSLPAAAHREKIVAHYLAAFGLPAHLTDELTLAMDGFAPADMREVVQSLSVVGVEHMAAEVARVQRQRSLYAGDACEKHLARRSSPEPLTKAAR